MARSNNVQMRVHQDIYDSKSMLDENNFYHQRHGKPDELSMKLTWLLGDNLKNFPLAMMTYGNVIGNGKLRNKGNVKELTDIQFTYPVMSRTNKASIVAENLYSAGDKPGIGHGIFKIPFTDNWIKRHYIIESELGIQAYVTADAVKEDGNWVYSVQLDPASITDYCDLSQLEAGVRWSELNTANPESESRGTEFKRVAPGKYKNQMGVVRLSHGWAGNSSNKVMSINIQTEKGSTNLWMDWETWLFEKAWLEELENSYWYSRYNRHTDGTIPLKDLLTGKVIPRGSGILEQIPNYHTYSRLTYNKLQNVIGDAMFGQSDTEGMTITLHTGKGGMREIDRVMKEQGASFLTDFTGVADKFVMGTGRDLMLGGFFSGFYHIDGYVVKIKHNPIFDNGRMAQKSPLHPETGLPLESYRMVFIDDSDYDGEANLQHVTEKGRSFLHGVVQGMSPTPKSLKVLSGKMSEDELALISSDTDKSSYHRMSVCGIQIKRATKCLHLECIAGL